MLDLIDIPEADEALQFFLRKDWLRDVRAGRASIRRLALLFVAF